jgi:31-O-methyltransferase
LSSSALSRPTERAPNGYHFRRKSVLVDVGDNGRIEADARTADVDAERLLTRELGHYDDTQLLFQIAEIARERTYLQHGVELKGGDTVLDVGANVGVAAAFFAIEGAGVVHAFEPVAPIFELLRENVARFPACVAHNFGLGTRTATAQITFYRGANAMSGLYADPERDREFVRARMLAYGLTAARVEAEVRDRFVPEILSCELRTLSAVIGELGVDHVDLLKIDVERAELDVLHGLDPPDWDRIAQIVCELSDERGRLREVVDLLTENGFAVSSDQDQAMAGTPMKMVYATRR